ncbi:unnamed protein product [Arabidopsis thaliana]|uniref:C2 domain-containing protein n=3 Tax=Arabidopsis thaliana TaxID=3702 RepID=Q9LIN7_ARATH|nr:unnamed protein product [Arabidopsis thaliana]CAA0383754.1 unnamed protein product [Arabidopsis thaliana]CAD5324197.1 unnamed protein product [Arabidopsis thaliana]VYS58676.1 unnamed protein product [Arabidopsis thaliana]
MMKNLGQAAAKKRRLMISKGKRKINEDETTDLIVRVGAFASDDKTLLKRYEGFKKYVVVLYTDPEERDQTQVIKVYHGDKLKFNKEVMIRLDSHASYLYVELLGLSSRKDPGTSHGVVVMGRAKIGLPNSHEKIYRKASLVLLNSDRCLEEKGSLHISMKLERTEGS